MAKTISSQHYRDSAITATKLEIRDFRVFISPEFEVGGETVCVILDGHHSLEASRLAGIDPEYVTVDARWHDAIALIHLDKAEEFLAAVQHDGDYYDISTGLPVW